MSVTDPGVRARGRAGWRHLAAATLGVLASARLATAQCPDGTPPPCGRPAPSAGVAPSANSVAVMLFNNVTRDTANAYLADGLATEIATSLARVPRLEVRSPGAVRSAMRGIEPDPRLVGRRLNVRYVVEGDFQRGGDRIRVSVRLVAVAEGTQRWSDAYTRPASDLLAVQEEIANAVATATAGRLLPQERSVLATRATDEPEAYDHFLRGNFELAKRTPAGVARGITEYEQAARIDPDFARAEALIALGYALYLDWGWDFPGVPRDSQLARGERAAEHALARDSLSADAWMAIGYLRSFRFPRTLEGVLPALARATQLDPRNAEAWHQYGSWLAMVGRLDEGNAAARRSLGLEPGRAVTWAQMGQNYEVLRQEAEARTAYDSAIAADPAFYAAYAFRTWVRLRAGDSTGARADAEAAMRLSPPGETYYGSAPLAAVAASAGDTAAARRIVAEAVLPFASRPPGPFVSQMLALGFVAAGQPDEAMATLERTEPHGAVLWNLMLFPGFDPLRRLERFQRLLAAVRPPGAP